MPKTKAGAFIADVLDYDISDGVVCVTIAEQHFFMPMQVFRRSMARAQRVIQEYEAKKAEVVPLNPKGRRRGQAARSRGG